MTKLKTSSLKTKTAKDLLTAPTSLPHEFLAFEVPEMLKEIDKKSQLCNFWQLWECTQSCSQHIWILPFLQGQAPVFLTQQTFPSPTHSCDAQLIINIYV